MTEGGGVKVCDLTWEQNGFLTECGNHSEKQTILWPGLSDKSWRHGLALQMAALGPISLTQKKLIFTREDNTACSEKIAG